MTFNQLVTKLQHHGEVVVTYYPQQEPTPMHDFLDFVNKQIMINTAYEYLMLALSACVMIGMLMMAVPALLAVAVYFTIRAVVFGEWGRLYDRTR